MQHHRDKSADGGDKDHSSDGYADIGEILLGLWCLKELRLAVPAFRHREIYGFSASRTYSFHMASSVSGDIGLELF
jgi:hypothetical protein